MVVVQDLETIIKRQKEVFNHFITYRGREESLLPLLKKYSKEDSLDGEYEFSKLLEYLDLFINSDLITPTQLELYQNTKKISVHLIEERGREVLNAFIEAKGSWELVAPLAKKYEREDGRVIPYERRLLSKYRNYFITHNIDSELIAQYNLVMELAKRPTTDGYDIELLNSILKLPHDEAIKFIKKINISKNSIKALRNVYGTLYPANKEQLNDIDSIIEEAYKRIIPPPKFTPANENPNSRINKLKLLLDAYLVRDTKDISTLFEEYGMSRYSFKEALKDALVSKDQILLNLLDKYNIKEQIILSERKVILDTIINARSNGINYGNGYKQFNIFDLYSLTDTNIELLIEAARKLYSPSIVKTLVPYLRNLGVSRIYDSLEELFSAVNYGTNGRMLTDDEKSLIISYMNQMNWPYSVKLFTSMAKRYIEGDFIIEVENEDYEKNNQPMNKI